MKSTRRVTTYDKENSCLEDVLAIASELTRGIQLAQSLDSKNSALPPQKAKKKTGFH